MPLEQRQVKEWYRIGWSFALGVCILALPFIDPFRSALLPPLAKFVKNYIEVFLNLLYFIFFICSMTLITLAVLVHREYRRAKVVLSPYDSQMVVKNYYQASKRLDVTRAIVSAISKYSRRDFGATEGVEEIKADGSHQIFYQTGQLEKEFTYLKGKLNGAFRSYYPSGMLHQEKFYKDGKLYGVFKACDESGVPFFQTDYHQGKKHGSEKIFFMNGNIQYLDTYHEGKMTSRKTYDEGGELKFDYDYREEEIQ